METPLQDCLNALDKVLGQQIFPRPMKVVQLREIERAAKRMADGIEQRERPNAA